MSKVLVLRTCNADMRSTNGFFWPEEGPVSCQDWDPKPVCGGGLHGLLWGEGDGDLLDWDDNAKWLVVSVDEDLIVKIDQDKVKFPNGEVVYCGDRKGATDRILAECPFGTVVVGAFHTVGDEQTAVVGYRGTATAGTCGTATAGKCGIATAGREGTATAGDWGTATAGFEGTATAGWKGTATAGAWGTATAGYQGTATAGDRGTATAGHGGTATAGVYGTATAGENGRIEIEWFDNKSSRFRKSIGYIGEGDLLANVPYKCDDHGNFVRVSKPKPAKKSVKKTSKKINK